MADKRQVAGSLMWKFLERGGVQVTQLIVSIVIARLLLPDAFGAVALLSIFITIANVFVQSGLNTALIQKKDADAVDESSVFYYSLLVAVVIYVILYFVAPLVSTFFKIPALTSLLRVLALTLFPGALNSLQLAILSKKMQFRKQFNANIIASVLSGVIGILMAFLKFEAWALVAQQLTYQVSICVVLWFQIKWRPRLMLSFQRTRKLLSYGSKLLGANLIDTLYHNLESLIIGRMFSPAALAYCNKGKMFPLILSNNIDGSIQSVMLPAYSSRQEDIAGVKNMLRKTVSLSTYLVFPLMILLAVVAEPTILLLLGRNWVGAVPYMQLFCVMTVLFPLQTASLQAVNAIGLSGMSLKIMAWKRSIGVIFLLGSVWVWRSPFAVVIAALLVEAFAVCITLPVNRKLFSYTFPEFLVDIVPNLLLALMAGLVAWLLHYCIANPYLLLVGQLLIGGLIFIALSWVLKNRNMMYILKLLPAKMPNINILGKCKIG